MKTSKLLFLHGYGSSAGTNKFTEIPYTTKEAIPLDYDLGFDTVYKKAEEKLLSMIDDAFEVVVVGHSFGGLLAHELSKKYNVSAVLIAPSLRADINYPHLFTDNSYVNTLSNARVEVLIEQDDEVIPYKTTLEALKGAGSNYNIKLFEGGDHRIMRASEVTVAIANVSTGFPEFP